MGRWLILLGGLLIWAIHFLGVYAIASLAEAPGAVGGPQWRWAGVAFSIFCAAAAAGFLAWLAATADVANETSRFMTTIAALGAVIALAAIGWQTLPLLIG